jgi:hypothetical protein
VSFFLLFRHRPYELEVDRDRYLIAHHCAAAFEQPAVHQSEIAPVDCRLCYSADPSVVVKFRFTAGLGDRGGVESRPMSAGSGLCLVAYGVAFFGLMLASQATLGVAVVGVACLLGITARMIQAQYVINRSKDDKP